MLDHIFLNNSKGFTVSIDTLRNYRCNMTHNIDFFFRNN